VPRPSRPPPADGSADPAADRRARALEEPLDVTFRPDPRFLRVEVRNPSRGTRYTVVLPSFPAREGGFCTCTDFARRGLGTCKHLEAAWIWTGEHAPEANSPRPPAPVGRGWAEIDRRTRGTGKGPLTPITLRLPGAALLAV
jgi:hypothetical protein